ncbi:HEPN domain-containing protein [Thermococcus thermotolerans]|nr:HEPN domain-containing protein [Thermococcus thermotolerans]
MSFREWLKKAEKDLVLAKNSLSLDFYDYATSTLSSALKRL